MIRAQDDYPFRSDLQPLRSVSVQRRAEKPLEPGRPAQKTSVEQTARSTDLLMRLEPSTRSRWPGGATPRLAGLGEAARPPLSASDDKLSRGVEAKEEVA